MSNDLSLLRELYDCERKQDNRNYAKDHGFEEWLQNRAALGCPQQTSIAAIGLTEGEFEEVVRHQVNSETFDEWYDRTYNVEHSIAEPESRTFGQLVWDAAQKALKPHPSWSEEEVARARQALGDLKAAREL